MEGPILAVIAGFLCAEGFLDPLIVYPVIGLGDICGDSLLYSLGRWGKSRPAGRWFALIGLQEEKIERARSYFKSNPVKTISVSKIILGVGVAGIFLAGNSRIPYRKFLTICILTSAAQYAVYLGVGLLFGRAYTLVIILSVAIFFIYILKTLGKRR